MSTYGDGFTVYHVDYTKKGACRDLNVLIEERDDNDTDYLILMNMRGVARDSDEEEEESIEQEKTKEEFRVWPKYKQMKAKNTKFNSIVRIGKSKWLCFDWDKCRYVVWDSKK